MAEISPLATVPLDSSHLDHFRSQLVQTVLETPSRGVMPLIFKLYESHDSSASKTSSSTTSRRSTRSRKRRRLNSTTPFLSDETKARLLREVYDSARPGLISQHLSVISSVELNRLYEQFCSATRFAFGKMALGEELERYYYKGSLQSVRRAEETQALETHTIEMANLFFVLHLSEASSDGVVTKKMVLTKDVMSILISFLPSDRRLLCGVGMVSWDFYVLVISTWNSIKITKRNICAIPITILRAARELSFFGAAKTKGRVPMKGKEMLYVLKNVITSRIRKISFACFPIVKHLLGLLMTLREFGSGNSDCHPLFESLEELRILPGPDEQFGREYYSSYGLFLRTSKQSLGVATYAPNLRVVSGPFRWSQVSDLSHLTLLRCRYSIHGSWTWNRIEEDDSTLNPGNIAHFTCLKHLCVHRLYNYGQAPPIPSWFGSLVSRLVVLNMNGFSTQTWVEICKAVRGKVLPLRKLALAFTVYWNQLIDEGFASAWIDAPSLEFAWISGIPLRYMECVRSSLSSLRTLVLQGQDLNVTEEFVISLLLSDVGTVNVQFLNETGAQVFNWISIDRRREFEFCCFGDPEHLLLRTVVQYLESLRLYSRFAILLRHKSLPSDSETAVAIIHSRCCDLFGVDNVVLDRDENDQFVSRILRGEFDENDDLINGHFKTSWNLVKETSGLTGEFVL